jgi:hypothetical protein
MVTGLEGERGNALTKEADGFFVKPCGPLPIREFLIKKGLLH